MLTCIDNITIVIACVFLKRSFEDLYIIFFHEEESFEILCFIFPVHVDREVFPLNQCLAFKFHAFKLDDSSFVIQCEDIFKGKDSGVKERESTVRDFDECFMSPLGIYLRISLKLQSFGMIPFT